MLQIGKSQMIEGVTVYEDADEYQKFYLVGGEPGYKTDAQGRPSLSLFKYRFPVDREDGRVGGGFVLLDVSFSVSLAKQEAVRQVLQPQVNRKARELGEAPPTVEFAPVRYIDGTCNLIIAEADGTLVEKVSGSGKPSLYGENTATFGVELTPEGATFFEQALQSQGPVIGIEYDLTASATLPPITAHSHFHAERFYKFHQEVNTEMRFWREDERTEIIRERMKSTESITMEIDFGELTDAEQQEEIRTWIMDTTSAAVERNMIEAIAPVPEDKRDLPDKIEDVTRDFRQKRISDFELTFNERRPVEWNLRPNGSLPPFSTLTDIDGNALNWEDYSRTIDLDDPEFRKVRVNVMVNADFEELPLHSVEVKLTYKGRPMPNLAPGEPEGETVMTDPTALGKFAAFIENDSYDYDYSYQINYKNENRIYQSDTITTDEGNLTIGVGDLGILDVQIGVGDINWSEVSRALVTFRYEDTGVAPIEQQISLTEAAPSHRIREVIFEPMRQYYSYQVKYFMKDGSEYVSGLEQSRSPDLFINDVFSKNRTITVNGLADFQTRVANIFVDLAYDDDENDHHLTKSMVLNASNVFGNWTFPVISATAGKVFYSGTVAFKDGTQQVIERTEAETDTILVPRAPEAVLDVEVISDLIDWSATRLVRVTLNYVDDENGVNESATMTFSPTRMDPQTWSVPVMDASKMAYSYEWTFFNTDGSRITKGPTETTDAVLILDPMAS
ncbi:hypothetical protein KUV28_17690 [Ferrimonas balearica]|nr:hypothetical protein [Ferrimonas balearica]